MSRAKFLELSGRINDLLNAASILAWDSRTMMPASGAETRGQQIATLTVAARDLLCSDAMRHALDAAEAEVANTPGTAEAAMVEQVRAAQTYHDRIPVALVQQRNLLAVTAHEVWAGATREKDFAIFAPALTEMVEVCRAWADAAGYEKHPYDALLTTYEQGNTVAGLDQLLGRLRDHVVPLAREVHAAPQPDDSFLFGSFDPARQRQVASALAQQIGYDLSRGRIDTALHPFEISFTREDVRLTTWVSPKSLSKAIFTTLHEAGHGIYEQNIDPAFTRTPLATDLILLYAVGGVSFGMHESQSRLWENHVGRSRAFWARHYGTLRDAFPDQLGSVSVEQFWRAINRSAPGTHRTHADELTYDLHVIFRTEIERDLIAGTLPVAEVRDAWNDATKAALGVSVPDDAEGVLQDVHWATGQFGTFCNYTVGNVVAAQLFETAANESDVAAGLAQADYTPLRGWLREHVMRHGRRHIRDELLTKATGRPIDPAPYLAHLTRRFGEVYDLN